EPGRRKVHVRLPGGEMGHPGWDGDWDYHPLLGQHARCCHLATNLPQRRRFDHMHGAEPDCWLIVPNVTASVSSIATVAAARRSHPAPDQPTTATQTAKTNVKPQT